LDKLKANVMIGGGGGGGRGRGGRFIGGAGEPGTLVVSIDTVRKNLPAVIDLVGELLRESTFPESEFDKLHKQSLSMLEQGRSEPQVLAGVALRRKMSPYGSDDIRYVPTIDEQIERIKAIKLDDVKKAYSDLLGASFAEAA